MAEQLSRKKLHDLVWSEPMRNLCVRFGISDVALKKTCARAGILTPERGYWAKKEPGRRPFSQRCRCVLPGRMTRCQLRVEAAIIRTDTGTMRRFLASLALLHNLPSRIETVRTRIAETLDHVAVPHNVRTWHPAIGRLLKEDEKRREKQLTDPYPMSWDKPLFETPFERRRLRVLNSLFLAVAKMNGKPFVHDREARKIRISLPAPK